MHHHREPGSCYSVLLDHNLPFAIFYIFLVLSSQAPNCHEEPTSFMQSRLLSLPPWLQPYVLAPWGSRYPSHCSFSLPPLPFPGCLALCGGASTGLGWIQVPHSLLQSQHFFLIPCLAAAQQVILGVTLAGPEHCHARQSTNSQMLPRIACQCLSLKWSALFGTLTQCKCPWGVGWGWWVTSTEKGLTGGMGGMAGPQPLAVPSL